MEATIIGPMPLQGSDAPAVIENRGSATVRAREIRKARKIRIADIKRRKEIAKRQGLVRPPAAFAADHVRSVCAIVDGTDVIRDEAVGNRLRDAVNSARRGVVEAGDDETAMDAAVIALRNAQIEYKKWEKARNDADKQILQQADCEILAIRMARMLVKRAATNSEIMKDVTTLLRKYADTFGKVTRK